MVESEEIRRIRRTLHELCKRLDDEHSRCRFVADLFKPQVALLRVKMRDYSIKMWNVDPVKNGVSAVDLYWRKGIYDTFTAAKTVKQGWTPVERAYVKSHLFNGIGFLHHILSLVDELKAEFVRKSKRTEIIGALGALDFCNLPPYGHESKTGGSKGVLLQGHDLDRVESFLKSCAHRCLLCIGDLNRYMIDLGSNAQLQVAERYYFAALAVDPSNGAPYNQLASMASTGGSADYGLEPAFFYLRGLNCGGKQFDGIEANFKSLLEKNEKAFDKYEALVNAGDGGLPELSPARETERCAVYLLRLLRISLFADVNTELSSTCKKALEALQHCLYLPLQSGEVDGTQWQNLLPEQIACKMALLLVMAMQMLENDEVKLSMLRAYLLAFFCHLVTKILADLHLGLHGPEAIVELFESAKEKADREEKEKLRLQEEERKREEKRIEREARQQKAVKAGLERFKRQRRRQSDSSSSGGDEDASSQGSNEESGSDDIPDRDSNSRSESDNDGGEGIFASESDEDFDDSGDDVIVESSQDILSITNLVRLVEDHHLNPALRVCGFWLTGSRSVVVEAAKEQSDVIWERLAKLFTTLSLENPEYVANEAVTDRLEQCRSANVGRVYPEDYRMRGIKAFDKSTRTLDWNWEGDRDDDNAGIQRILDLLKFRDWLCSIPHTGLALEEGWRVVSGERRHDRGTDDDEGDDEDGGRQERGAEATASDTTDIDTKRGGVLKVKARNKEEEQKAMMKNMAQLWLQQEVNELEGRGSSKRGGFRGFAHYSPYIVVDHLAISRHLPLVKEMVASKKFAVIIPSAVIQELDDMKKAESGARTAIRWLEKQFRDGNRWLRSQKKTEAKQLELIQYPKKKERAAWQYFKILECCNHFGSVRGEESSAVKMRVTLLTCATPQEEERGEGEGEGEEEEVAAADGAKASVEVGASGGKAVRQKAAVDIRGIASALDIRVENIDSFVQRPASPRKQRNRSKSRLKARVTDEGKS